MSAFLPLGNRWVRLSLMLFLAFFLFDMELQAQLIGNWTFTGNTNGTGSADNSVSAADFSAGIPTRAFNGGNEYYGQNGWSSGAASSSTYLEFTLTPNSGHYLSIFSVVLRMRRSSTGSPSGSGPNSWSIRSSLDGYTNDISSGTITHGYANYTVMPGGGFGAIYSAVTFRVYGYNATISSGGNSRMVFDNIQVVGMGPLLPVHLLSFSGRSVNENVLLDYSVANTEPGTKYQVERSINGIDFGGVNNKTETQTVDRASYQFIDNTVPRSYNQLFYRLRLTDLGGRSTYSAVISISLNKISTSLKARISGQSLTLYGDLKAGEIIAVYNNSGNCILKTTVNTSSGYQTLSLRLPNLSKGIYYVQVADDKQQQVLKVMSE